MEIPSKKVVEETKDSVIVDSINSSTTTHGYLIETSTPKDMEDVCTAVGLITVTTELNGKVGVTEDVKYFTEDGAKYTDVKHLDL